MYKNCVTQVKANTWSTEAIELHAGLHPGSALSPLPFIIIMHVIADSVGSNTL